MIDQLFDVKQQRSGLCSRSNGAPPPMDFVKPLFRFGCATDFTSHIQLQVIYSEIQSVSEYLLVNLPKLHLFFCRLLSEPGVVEAHLDIKKHSGLPCESLCIS